MVNRCVVGPDGGGGQPLAAMARVERAGPRTMTRRRRWDGRPSLCVAVRYAKREYFLVTQYAFVPTACELGKES